MNPVHEKYQMYVYYKLYSEDFYILVSYHIVIDHSKEQGRHENHSQYNNVQHLLRLSE